MVEEEFKYGLNRFNDLPQGPTVTIYGEVRWPQDWTTEQKQDWIRFKRSVHETLYPGQEPNPDGEIAVLEYDLDPAGRRPDYLGALRKANPNVEWPDDRETLEVQEETTIPDTPVSVFDVAKSVLERYESFAGTAFGSMTAWKLQKLVYYCQAWSLALDKEPLFEEDIEAWKYGPVVHKLFTVSSGQYKIHTREINEGDPSRLSAKQQKIVDRILKHYGPRDPDALSKLTHDEPPWRNARKRGGLKDGERGKEIITPDDMEKYYSTKMLPK